MFILNATKEQLDTWYKCNRFLAEYLIYKCNIPLISRKGMYYYFVKTEELDRAIKKAPIIVKISARL